MSFGRLIVATIIDGLGVDWVNKDKISGVNTEIKNLQVLACAFSDISNDKIKYEEYCMNVKVRFQFFFTRENMVNNIIHLYKEVLLLY